MPFACDAGGAEKYENDHRHHDDGAATTKLCHSPSVWPSGMTPLIFSMASGSDAGAAMISAADDDRPSAHTLPTPR
jgi:hypothetical protein